jgi:hypothetical protein
MRYPRAIEIQPSRLMQVLSAAIHVIAAFAFLRSSIHLLIVLPMLAMIGLSWRAVWRAEMGRKGRVLTLDEGAAFCIRQRGRTVYALPEASCVDFGWAVWLHWRGAHVARARRPTLHGAMMLLPDNLPADSWRDLRIWLRHEAGALHGGDAPP